MNEKLSVGQNGQIELPEEHRRRWGLSPGVELSVRETPEGLLLCRADPALTKLYIEPTTCCNLSCRTCVRNSWSEPERLMGMDTYRRLIEGLRGVQSLRSMHFWGFGEPLLHPNIVEMVALAKGLGSRTQVITNGLLLNRQMSQGLMEVGLDSLVVSVDGTTVEAHADVRRGADLGQVRRNIEGLCALRDRNPEGNPEIGLEFVLMRRNVGELGNLLRLARSMEASFVMVSHVLPYTEELTGEALYGSSAGTCYPTSRSKYDPEVLLPRMDWRRELEGQMLGLLQHSRVNNSPLGRVEDSRGYCRFVGEGAAVVAQDGEVSPCIALMHSYGCYVLGRQKSIRRYTLGNVSRETLPEIWARAEYVRFRGLVREFDYAPCTDCGGCQMAESNEEDCLGNSFPVCGDCLWAKGAIQCP